jgi:hypothetical protein
MYRKMDLHKKRDNGEPLSLKIKKLKLLFYNILSSGKTIVRTN